MKKIASFLVLPFYLVLITMTSLLFAADKTSRPTQAIESRLKTMEGVETDRSNREVEYTHLGVGRLTGKMEQNFLIERETERIERGLSAAEGTLKSVHEAMKFFEAKRDTLPRTANLEKLKLYLRKEARLSPKEMEFIEKGEQVEIVLAKIKQKKATDVKDVLLGAKWMARRNLREFAPEHIEEIEQDRIKWKLTQLRYFHPDAYQSLVDELKKRP